MAGAPDYQTLTATLPSIAPVGGVQTETADLDAGKSETIYVSSASGTVARLSALATAQITVPSGASSGYHEIAVNTPETVGLILGTSNFNSSVTNLQYNFGFWMQAGVVQYPPAGTNQAWWANSQYCTATESIEFIYSNNTNATQTASRTYYWQLVEEDLP
jgi:hypothetical protein